MSVWIAITTQAVVVFERAWVGGIGSAWRSVRGTVVGQCKIDLAVGVVDRAPLWPVHFGGACGVSGNARVHQHFSLAGKAESGSLDLGVVDAELQPLTFASDVELGGVQLALVEVLVACCDAAADVGCVPVFGADKFVDVFVA